MHTKIPRRLLLGGALAGATAWFVHRVVPSRRAKALASSLPDFASAVDLPAGRPLAKSSDARVAQLVALSRDDRGVPHVERVAFVDERGASGTLAIGRAELADLRRALETRDLGALRERGLRVGGRKYVVVGADEDGTVIHAAARGRSFVTVRKARDQIVIATSTAEMAHGRAVAAVDAFVVG